MVKQKKNEMDLDQMLGRERKNHVTTALMAFITLAIFAIIIFFLLNLYTAKYAIA